MGLSLLALASLTPLVDGISFGSSEIIDGLLTAIISTLSNRAMVRRLKRQFVAIRDQSALGPSCGGFHEYAGFVYNELSKH